MVIKYGLSITCPNSSQVAKNLHDGGCRGRCRGASVGGCRGDCFGFFCPPVTGKMKILPTVNQQ